jgi:hypothetical protein
MNQKNKATSFCLLPVIFLFSTTYAAEKIKPGLWEMRMRSDEIKSMPKIPKEQQDQMKQMGIKIPTMEDGVMVTKICVTREMSERDDFSMQQKEQSSCKTQNMIRSKDSYSLDLICNSPELKGTGKVKGSYASTESMQSTYDFKGTSYERPISQHMETTGKWLSSDCGEIKPHMTSKNK